MAARIRRGDKVYVRSGRDKGKTGSVLKVLPKEGRAIVQGVNTVRKHQRQTPQEQAGIVSKEASIDLSNLALVDPRDDVPTRVGFRFLKDGRKVRYSKRTGEVIDG
jgi:large subunit ribosomal protein L24